MIFHTFSAGFFDFSWFLTIFDWFFTGFIWFSEIFQGFDLVFLVCRSVLVSIVCCAVLTWTSGWPVEATPLQTSKKTTTRKKNMLRSPDIKKNYAGWLAAAPLRLLGSSLGFAACKMACKSGSESWTESCTEGLATVPEGMEDFFTSHFEHHLSNRKKSRLPTVAFTSNAKPRRKPPTTLPL